ncbi:hypothetical protein AN9306.2 [Aspergillus nidulans FGSC A4]|uniref:Rhodopsin domain-containing protein n=1 Tax=Emericella nidulans (strain FGSC A4 / ATCC 38163 / CBS 112.46 / NRRL 194 / M139) TaxID=227321 RepID=Q5AQX4_EMENI|nr:hypothetical protein [Aspergillus nidulans FGSC A4]EAA66373.1 hypothetical protein AN9306.2 [Aspergillus nidulans FGSC A4]CBF87371.1 TPA: hypothetical protein ANIA_09306 [Aspergillus nidulans FGSC A4]|eukprot:XP_682575.1 hypothetical protein AN9306.2 [Aspergillus nidulans FGSC A4]
MDIDLTTTPGIEPPAGHIPQFEGPYNYLQIGTIIAFAVTYFFATLFISLRYFQAFKLTQKVELDLVTITVSYGIGLAYFVTMLDLFRNGWGKHMWDVSLAQLIELNKALLPNTICYLICPAISKLAILSVLYRINPAFVYRVAVVGTAVFIFTYTLALCIITGGPCSPLKDGTLQCLENVALSGAVLNISSDLIVISLPIPTIHNLQLQLKQKVTVGCLLALGSGVIVCSIARLPYVIRLRHTPDSTWTQAILGVWSIVEVNLGIICACAMRFKRLIATYLPRLSLWSFRSRSRTRSRSAGLQKTPLDSADKFRPDGSMGKHEYRLHSLQQSTGSGKRSGDGEEGSNLKDISVERSFEVSVVRTGSMERILS